MRIEIKLNKEEMLKCLDEEIKPGEGGGRIGLENTVKKALEAEGIVLEIVDVNALLDEHV